MIFINVRFSARELHLLTSLAADQLFHREFIDSRFPGHKSDSAELSLGKDLVKRLQSAADRTGKMPLATKNGEKL